MLLKFIVVIFIIWVVAQAKTSRPDGELIQSHPFRRLMLFVMPTRTESACYFETTVEADKLVEYLELARDRLNANMTHCLVAALNIGIAKTPSLNRFVSGQRLYQRKGRWFTFSMKRIRMDQTAKLSVVKLEMQDDESFSELCTRINGQIKVERSGKKTYADKEFALFNVLPRPLLRFFTAVFKSLDYYNLLPGSFIKNDGMYCSMFVANLGSLGMSLSYHHLYEWGNCPIFATVGKVEERAVVVNGEVTVQKTLPIVFTFDERINDGLTCQKGMEAMKLALQDPFTHLGCVKDDGSDVHPMLSAAS